MPRQSRRRQRRGRRGRRRRRIEPRPPRARPHHHNHPHFSHYGLPPNPHLPLSPRSPLPRQPLLLPLGFLRLRLQFRPRTLRQIPFLHLVLLLHVPLHIRRALVLYFDDIHVFTGVGDRDAGTDEDDTRGAAADGVDG
ncbi:hypothetical protein EX30DRAFT_340168 [Ascodesmis nigricans]|uniref:Uncharacterized protein n=1 Tax=Ascodesmis nigricans TaxID=341454 RepID=A0A4S2MZS5_9PEZI|nr:hypothetical protein EX30DRAFT_340168 [Ascodesmis nigricans]